MLKKIKNKRIQLNFFFNDSMDKSYKSSHLWHTKQHNKNKHRYKLRERVIGLA